MSNIAKEFFRDWVASSLDPDAPAKTNVKELLSEAEDAGITRDEMEAALGDIQRAVKKAMVSEEDEEGDDP